MTVVAVPPENPASAPKAWSDFEMTRIAEVAREAAGLVFSPNRIPSAEQGIRRAMHTLRVGDIAEFRRAVEEPGHAREALLAELTIGESYFFREPAQLEFVARELLPAWSEQRRTGATAATLRMWSAGCSNGEEPYSLAMLLREGAWRYGSEILASDISIPRLATARRGRYSEWSMRATPRPHVERYFEQTGKQYLIRREIRDMVRFRAVNLVSDLELPDAGASGMDVIFCRNVLIYFSMETVARVAERLLASLAPDGWLLISASDPPLTDLVRCETVTTVGGLAYRRRDRPGRMIGAGTSLAWPLDAAPAAAPAIDWPASPPPPARPLGTTVASGTTAAPPIGMRTTAPGAPARQPSPDLPGLESVYAAGEHDRAAEMAAARVAAGCDDERTRVLHVRALANRGRLDDAGAACAAALDRFPASPELHLLHATLLARAGQFGATVVAARRALYLDPTLVMAQIVGADAMTRIGDGRGAERGLRAAAAALAGLPAEQPVPAADGETAGRLQQIVNYHLSALSASGSR